MTSEPLATRAGHGGPAQPPGTDGTGYRAYVLAVLVLVYTVNFLDRQITSILAIPIKAELGLSDTQLGLMGGLAFALFYTALGIPIARLADGGSRTRIMTWALGFWSLMTAVCGFAQSFAQLFLARLGVGVGEAGGVAPAYSLICDYFPVRQRARALAVYAFGIPIGIALGMYAGGYIATVVGWRAAFWSVGVAGLVIAPLFRLTVREPVRGGLDAARPQASAATPAAERRRARRAPARARSAGRAARSRGPRRRRSRTRPASRRRSRCSRRRTCRARCRSGCRTRTPRARAPAAGPGSSRRSASRRARHRPPRRRRRRVVRGTAARSSARSRTRRSSGSRSRAPRS